MRRGGEQPEANRQSAGGRTRFGVNPWRACWMTAKPGIADGAETTGKAAIRRNKGAAGVDRQGIERFAGQAERYLTELHEQLKDGSYRPAPVKRVEIPKGDGKTRPLGIPTVQSLPQAKAGDRGWCRRRSNWPL